VRRVIEVFPSSHYALLALFFGGGLELMFAFQRLVLFVMGFFLVLVFVGVVIIRTEESEVFHPTQIILPVMTALSTSLFALFLPVNAFIHVYIALATGVFFYLLKYGARQAYPTWRLIITLTVVFTTLASILGWQYLLFGSLTLAVFLAGLAIFLLSCQLVFHSSQSPQETILVSATVTLGLMQLLWILQFLPLQYLAQSAIVTVVYYTIIQLVLGSYDYPVGRREILEHLGVGGVLLGVLLSVSQWS